MSILTLLDPVVLALHGLVVTIAGALPWPHGGTAVAAALALVTVAVRATLLPLAVRALRTERARAAIAPQLAALQRRHRNDPRRLLAETAQVQREAGVGPMATVLPMLAQLPVLASIYRLVALPTIAGHPNLVLTAQLFGAPLAAHWPQAVAAGGVLGTGTIGLLVGAALFLVLATLSSRELARRAEQGEIGTPQPAAASTVTRMMRFLPYGTVVFAAFAPVAVSLYLLTTTAWTVAERRFLPQVVPA